MKLIDGKTIKSLNIKPATCLEWVKESFSLKASSQLPPKPSVHPKGIDFITTMPCLLPPSNGSQRFGVKVVHRLEGCKPSLGSDMILYDAVSGELLALVDTDWITNMRTGAVATLAIQTLGNSRIKQEGVFSLIGLGNTARATMLCLLESEPDIMHNIQLLRYKDQAELFMERFKDYTNVKFSIHDDAEEMIEKSDVIISCVTQATDLICGNDNAFKPGCLVVPVHTRGFQNCDLTFDKVFADDTGHVCGFKYFNEFKSFGELQDAIEGKIAGRENDGERILSYNIGLGLHDVVYASKIYDMCEALELNGIEWVKETDKFWI